MYEREGWSEKNDLQGAIRFLTIKVEALRCKIISFMFSENINYNSVCRSMAYKEGGWNNIFSKQKQNIYP